MRSCFRQWYRFDLLNIVLLLLGIVLLVEGCRIFITEFKIEMLGPGGFPVIFCAFWVVGLIALITLEAIKPRMVSSKINIHDVRVIRGLLTVFLTLLYIFVVGKIGFIITSIVFQTALMIGFGATKKAHMALAVIGSVLSTGIIYVTYTMLFYLPLPGMV